MSESMRPQITILPANTKALPVVLFNNDPDYEFFNNFNWFNFEPGDMVYMEDHSNPAIDNFGLFRGVRLGVVYIQGVDPADIVE